METDFLKKIKPIYDGVQFGNKVAIFFALLMLYYVVNLFTSDINSGMTGGLEAERNIFNQITASVFTVFVVYQIIKTPSKITYSFVFFLSALLVYLAIRTYFSYINLTSNKGIGYFAGFTKLTFWMAGTIFCVKCFRYSKLDDLKRFIRLLVWVYLVFATYRLITQKAILSRLGISAGINAVGTSYMIAPLIMLAFKGKMKVLLFFYTAFICVYSAKRQAAAGMAIVTFFCMKDLYQTYFHKRKILAYILLIVGIYLGSGYIYRMFNDLSYRQERTEERGNVDSGRFELWTVALDGFERASTANKWFGGGPGAGQRYIGEYFPIARLPHSSYVQILTDYGYVGLFFFSAFLLSLLAYVVAIKNMDDRLVYLSICFSWMFHCFISHPGSMRFIFLAIGIGFIIYKQEQIVNHEGNQLDQRGSSDIT